MLAHVRRHGCGAFANRGGGAIHSGMARVANNATWGSTRNDLAARSISMRSRKMANLVIDTIDSNGQPVLPERIKSLVPRLKSYLRGSLPTVVDLEYRSFVVRCDVQEGLDHAGYWQLSVTEQDLAARESLHAHAVERSDAWMASPGDMSMDDTMLLSHWQAHHRHTCQHGDKWHAQWLSLNDCSPDPASTQLGTIAADCKCVVTSGTVRRWPRSYKTKSLQCQVGLAPPGYVGGAHASPLAVWHVEVPAHMRFSSGDVSNDSWESFLLLLSENASFLEEQNSFPNKLQHGSRVIHSMTLERAVRFVAHPTVSEVCPMLVNACRWDRLGFLCTWGVETHGDVPGHLTCACAVNAPELTESRLSRRLLRDFGLRVHSMLTWMCSTICAPCWHDYIRLIFCLSRGAVQIARHIHNTDTHGTDAQLESIVNRWGADALSALCDFHDDSIKEGRIERVCAHALKLI